MTGSGSKCDRTLFIFTYWARANTEYKEGVGGLKLLEIFPTSLPSQVFLEGCMEGVGKIFNTQKWNVGMG